MDDAIAFPGLPECKEELMHIAMGFEMSSRQRNPLPFCVGAIDGILIPIEKPAESERPAAYFTRKGYFALLVQALVDYEYRFRSFSCRVVSSKHYSLAQDVSGLGNFLRPGKLPHQFWICGDEAYCCTKSLIVTFPASECGPQDHDFNFSCCLTAYCEASFWRACSPLGNPETNNTLSIKQN